MKLDFLAILRFIMDFRFKFEWGDPFHAIFINKCFGKTPKNTVLSKNRGNLSTNEQIVLKNRETHFQKAETRFQNAQTALSRIFFARTWMESAQKKPADV